MANSYRVIDEATWERAMHCMVFRNSVEPAFCVTFEADVTEFKKYVKNNNLSFTYLNKKTNLFEVVNVPMMDDLGEYCTKAKKLQMNKKFISQVRLEMMFFNVHLCRG